MTGPRDPTAAQATIVSVEALEEARRRASARRARCARVEAAQQGDRGAFAQLYQETFPAVSRYVGAMLQSRGGAEDAVSETYLMAWRDLRKLRDPVRFDAWLFRIAHHRALAEAKQRRASALDAGQEPAESSVLASPSGLLDLQADIDAVREALAELSEDQRLVVQLRFFADLSHADIAERLGKSSEAVRQLQTRALRQLRVLLRAGADMPHAA